MNWHKLINLLVQIAVFFIDKQHKKDEKAIIAQELKQHLSIKRDNNTTAGKNL